MVRDPIFGLFVKKVAIRWFCTLVPIGISAVQRIKGGRTILPVGVAFVVYQLFFLIFNR